MVGRTNSRVCRVQFVFWRDNIPNAKQYLECKANIAPPIWPCSPSHDCKAEVDTYSFVYLLCGILVHKYVSLPWTACIYEKRNANCMKERTKKRQISPSSTDSPQMELSSMTLPKYGIMWHNITHLKVDHNLFQVHIKPYIHQKFNLSLHLLRSC